VFDRTRAAVAGVKRVAAMDLSELGRAGAKTVVKAVKGGVDATRGWNSQRRANAGKYIEVAAAVANLAPGTGRMKNISSRKVKGVTIVYDPANSEVILIKGAAGNKGAVKDALAMYGISSSDGVTDPKIIRILVDDALKADIPQK